MKSRKKRIPESQIDFDIIEGHNHDGINSRLIPSQADHQRQHNIENPNDHNVEITNLQNGDTLYYDASTQKWKNTQMGGHSRLHNIESPNDHNVEITNLGDRHILKFNIQQGKWKNEAFTHDINTEHTGILSSDKIGTHDINIKHTGTLDESKIGIHHIDTKHTGNLPENRITFDNLTGHNHNGTNSRKISHNDLNDITADQHHPKLHKNSHISGGEDAFTSDDIIEALVKRIRTSDNVNLTFNTIPDGTYLRRVGSVIKGETISGGGINFSVWFVLNAINTNTWYLPNAINCTALTTLALTANRIYYMPFIPLRNVTITSLAVEVTTASSGTGQVGIYDTANYRPNNLLGYISIDTGTTGVKSGNVSINLTVGELYWLAIINSAGATIRAIAVGGLTTLLGIATGGTAYNTHYYQAGSNGVLPTTAGANTNGTGNVPAIYVRFS